MSDPNAHCHTIDPNADAFEETLRMRIWFRTIDTREDAELIEYYCAVCGHILVTKWREYLCRHWLGKVPV